MSVELTKHFYANSAIYIRTILTPVQCRLNPSTRKTNIEECIKHINILKQLKNVYNSNANLTILINNLGWRLMIRGEHRQKKIYNLLSQNIAPRFCVVRSTLT